MSHYYIDIFWCNCPEGIIGYQKWTIEKLQKIVSYKEMVGPKCRKKNVIIEDRL